MEKRRKKGRKKERRTREGRKEDLPAVLGSGINSAGRQRRQRQASQAEDTVRDNQRQRESLPESQSPKGGADRRGQTGRRSRLFCLRNLPVLAEKKKEACATAWSRPWISRFLSFSLSVARFRWEIRCVILLVLFIYKRIYNGRVDK
jgi:hypothetical protein